MVINIGLNEMSGKSQIFCRSGSHFKKERRIYQQRLDDVPQTEIQKHKSGFAIIIYKYFPVEIWKKCVYHFIKVLDINLEFTMAS